jgi:hypothetical protein
VTSTWPDDSIVDKWLEVTVKPTVNTGLTHPDVFFYGNLVGTVGGQPFALPNPSLNPRTVVGAGDPSAISRPLAQTCSVLSPYDINRDGKVDGADAAIAQANASHSLAMICLFQGDATLDGKIDINDLSRILTVYDQSGKVWTDGDVNHDGKVDINDLSIILTNYNKIDRKALAALLGIGGLVCWSRGKSSGWRLPSEGEESEVDAFWDF